MPMPDGLLLDGDSAMAVRRDMIDTTAWVLHSDPKIDTGLVEEPFAFERPGPEEVLVEPLFGCWEANMTHALEREPVNIGLLRREPRVVLGNSGVVRVLKAGSATTGLKEGDICLFCGLGQVDAFGYIKLVHAYDMPGSVGLLAKRTKVHARTLAPIPATTRFSLPQWAAFSVRYATAGSNWKVALGAFRLQVGEDELPRPYVWGWGGGSTLAELDLAHRMGAHATMISGSDHGLAASQALGLETIDRRLFPDISTDPDRLADDRAYLLRYQRAERKFIKLVEERTEGLGVSIFIDYIGAPVYRATLRALGRQGVITTAGWKHGMDLSLRRGTECIKRHVHVFTHGARMRDVVEAMNFAEATGWMPEVGQPYRWDEVPALSEDYAAERLNDYFPIFEVNPV